MSRDYDVVGLGGMGMDLVLEVDHLPPLGQKVLGRYVGHLPGGTVPNFACAAARLGLRVAMHATVGADAEGDALVADLVSFGVDATHVARRDTPGDFTVIMIEPSGERAIVVVPMADGQVDERRLAPLASRTRYLYTMAGTLARYPAIGDAARAGGAGVMIDVEATFARERAALERLLPVVEIASFNEAGFRVATGEPPTIQAARALLDAGPRLVVVTLGAQGALAVSVDETARHPGFAVEVRDTTGAGDTFNAAFLTATVEGVPLDRAVAFANGAAALAVTGLGPRGRLPTREEVERLLISNLKETG